MPRLQGLLKRTSRAEELELEAAGQGSVARLERLLAQREGAIFDDDEIVDEPDEVPARTDEADAVAAVEPDAGDAAPEAAAPPVADATLVPVMAAEAVDATRRRAARVVHRTPTRAAPASKPKTAGTAKPAGNANRAVKAAAPTVKPATAKPARPAKSPVVPPPPPRGHAAASSPVHPKRAPRQPRQPTVLAACPSCAVLLDPRPTASRRCGQCRERIVVKRLEGGVLYLTAPAAAALEAAQRRLKETARLARARSRWLAQASLVGAPPASIERLNHAMATEEGVGAARALYLGAANRAFLAARRERRFAEAASIRRTHALSLYRELGASDSVPGEIVDLYRDAMSAELKAQREFGRDAELVAAPCCDICQADNGLIARISDEVKATRLPHAGCPKGICRCRWVPTRVGGRRPAAKAGSGQ